MHHSTLFTMTALLALCAHSLALPNPAPKAVVPSIFARQEGCPDIPQCVYAQDGSNLQGVNYCIDGIPQEAACPFGLPCTMGEYGGYCGY